MTSIDNYDYEDLDFNANQLTGFYMMGNIGR